MEIAKWALLIAALICAFACLVCRMRSRREATLALGSIGVICLLLAVTIGVLGVVSNQGQKAVGNDSEVFTPGEAAPVSVGENGDDEQQRVDTDGERSVPYTKLKQSELYRLGIDGGDDPVLISSEKMFKSYAKDHHIDESDSPSVNEIVSCLGDDYFNENDLIIVPFFASLSGSKDEFAGPELGELTANGETAVIHLTIDSNDFWLDMVQSGKYFLRVNKGACPSKVTADTAIGPVSESDSQ